MPDGHTASSNQEYVVNGAETCDRSNNAVDVGTALLLTAGAQELTWGMWSFDATNMSLASLDFDVDITAAPGGNNIYVAVANYADNCWEFYGPFTYDTALSLDDAKHKSSSGAVFCAAMAWDRATPMVLSVTLNAAPGQLAPQAELSADPPTGDPSLTVTFDASTSSDPDGSVVDYEWDLDGDGNFNEEGTEADSRGTATVQYTYEQAGAYEPAVRITDNDELTDEAELVVIVRGWVIIPLVYYLTFNDNSVGCVSLAVIDGQPAIAYTSNQGIFNYVRCRSPYGAARNNDWLPSHSVPAASSVGGVSLREIDGKPAIAAYGVDNGDLIYLHSVLPGGEIAASWQAVTFESTGDAGYAPSLAQIDGRPAIASFDRDNGELQYALSSSADGADAADWQFLPIAAAAGSSAWASLAVIDGKPAVAYTVDDATGLHYACADTVDGADAADWSTLSVDSGDGNGAWCSLALVDGKPAIAYQSSADLGGGELAHFLAYAFSATAQGAAAMDWSTIAIDAGSGDAGFSAGLASVGSQPAVGYYDDAAGSFMLATSSSAGGNLPGDWNSGLIETQERTSENCSFAEINGCPALCYYSHDGGDSFWHVVKYAILLQ